MRDRSSLHDFLLDLADSGRVEVARFAADRDVPGAADPAVDAPLLELDRLQRADAPGEAPALDADAARFGATWLYRACQLLADRDVDAPKVAEALALRCPSRADAPVIWSVDLTLRFLPDLQVLARGLAADDPLLAAIAEIGAAWPLSSVGLDLDPVPEPPAALREHASLAALYVDRVIERRDARRLEVPWVAERVRAALGAWPELAPSLRVDERRRPE